MKLKPHRDFFKECSSEGLDFFGDGEKPRPFKCPKHQGICSSKSCPKKIDYLVAIIKDLTK